MYGAYGTHSKVEVMYNGLKSIVTKCFEPTATPQAEFITVTEVW